MLSPAGQALILSALMAGRYISLHTGDPGDLGVSEVAAPEYTRKAAGVWTQLGSDPTVAYNSSLITFGPASTLWGTLTHFGIWESLTGGAFYGGQPFGASHFFDVGYIARFPINSLQVSAT